MKPLFVSKVNLDLPDFADFDRHLREYSVSANDGRNVCRYGTQVLQH